MAAYQTLPGDAEIRRLRTLYRLLASLSEARSLADVYDSALNALLESTAADRAAILFFDEDNVIRFKAWRGLSDEYRAAVTGHSPWKRGEREVQALGVADVLQDEGLAPYREVFEREGIRALCFVPLMLEAGVLGKFMLYYAKPHESTPDELEVAQAIAAHVALATERKRAEMARDESEQRLYGILDNSAAIIWLKDTQGRYQLMNRRCEELYHLTTAGTVGRTDYELFPEEIADRYVKNDRAVLEAGRAMAVEECAYHDDGVHTYISVKFPVKTRDGRVVAIGGIGTDITDRKQLEDASRRLSAIVESSGDAIYIYDFEGKILTWNQAAQELYGFEAREVIGRSVDAIVPEERIQELQDTLKAAVQGGRTLRNLETLRMKRDGSVFPAVLTVSPIRDESGRPVALAVIARDISDQKRREESLRETQKLESLGLLAGGIAHDFNNLLTGVIGNASLLEGEFPGDSPQAEIVQALIEAAERMSRLTSQMLAYSGRGHFVVEPVDLSKEVLRITSLIQASMPKNVELRLSLSNSLPMVNADISQLQQIIMNLVINAAEAVGGANGTVELRTGVEEVGERELRCNVTRNTPPAGRYVALTVQDTGCGMDEATQARIFDPFFTTKFTGRGLGLSSVLGIVRGHNGLIMVESQPGAGSNFRVFFPISGAAMTAEAPEAQETPGSGTVLVVDDEDVVRSIARAALQRLGYRVVTASNGQEAAELFAKNPAGIDLVLLDMTMPVMAGEQTLKRLLEIRPDARVLAMSGFDEREAKQRFGDSIAGFIQKPFTAGQLGAKIGAARQARRD